MIPDLRTLRLCSGISPFNPPGRMHDKRDFLPVDCARETAMHLSHHNDAKAHQRYVKSSSPEMKIPDAVVPKLPLGLFHQRQQVGTIRSKSALKSSANSARPAR